MVAFCTRADAEAAIITLAHPAAKGRHFLKAKIQGGYFL